MKTECPKCGKEFRYVHNLSRHLNKTFDCSKKVLLNTNIDFDSSIESMETTKKDKEILAGSNNFCKKCGKEFYGKWKLNKHLNKKFDCSKKRSL